MATATERTPHQKETLIFPNVEAADTFREQVSEKLTQPQPAGGKQSRQVVADAVAQEFAKQGEAVALVKEPWTHTSIEHDEAQQLVNVAFQKDLGAAVAAARKSKHYPRNLDLLHDVLTGEMYDLLREGKLNRQPLAGWVIGLGLAALLVFLAVLFVVASL